MNYHRWFARHAFDNVNWPFASLTAAPRDSQGIGRTWARIRLVRPMAVRCSTRMGWFRRAMGDQVCGWWVHNGLP